MQQNMHVFVCQKRSVGVPVVITSSIGEPCLHPPLLVILHMCHAGNKFVEAVHDTLVSHLWPAARGDSLWSGLG